MSTIFFPNPPRRACFRLALLLHRNSFPLSVPINRLFKHLDNFWIFQSFPDFCWAERNTASVPVSLWSIQAHAATWALIPHCNVPDSPTSEEDATMALTIRATSPMNMWNHKMQKCWKKMHWSITYTDAIIYHTQQKQHTFIQAFIQHVHHNH